MRLLPHCKNPRTSVRGVGQANLGVIHQDIETSLSVNGIEDPTGTLATNVREANRRLQDDADKLELYPVANIGVAYRF